MFAFFKKYKKRLLIFTFILVLIICLTTFVQVSMNLFATEPFADCLSVAFFEKQKMASVDKIVVVMGDKEAVITDASIMKEVAEVTSLATHVGYGCPSEAKIYAYDGEKLIRSMDWSITCNHIKVYESDWLHWLLNMDGWAKEGYVIMPVELESKIVSMVNNN